MYQAKAGCKNAFSVEWIEELEPVTVILATSSPAQRAHWITLIANVLKDRIKTQGKNHG